MNNVINFNRFKFSRENYYMDLFINKSALCDIEKALNERLDSIYMTKDEQYAYMKLKSIFEVSRNENTNLYAEVRINKCFVKYIDNLSFYFENEQHYAPLKILNQYLQENLIEDKENINNFGLLSEEFKIDVLTYV